MKFESWILNKFVILKDALKDLKIKNLRLKFCRKIFLNIFLNNFLKKEFEN